MRRTGRGRGAGRQWGRQGCGASAAGKTEGRLGLEAPLLCPAPSLLHAAHASGAANKRSLPAHKHCCANLSASPLHNPAPVPAARPERWQRSTLTVGATRRACAGREGRQPVPPHLREGGWAVTDAVKWYANAAAGHLIPHLSTRERQRRRRGSAAGPPHPAARSPAAAAVFGPLPLRQGGPSGGGAPRAPRRRPPAGSGAGRRLPATAAAASLRSGAEGKRGRAIGLLEGSWERPETLGACMGVARHDRRLLDRPAHLPELQQPVDVRPGFLWQVDCSPFCLQRRRPGPLAAPRAHQPCLSCVCDPQLQERTEPDGARPSAGLHGRRGVRRSACPVSGSAGVARGQPGRSAGTAAAAAAGTQP